MTLTVNKNKILKLGSKTPLHRYKSSCLTVMHPFKPPRAPDNFKFSWSQSVTGCHVGIS